MGYLKSLGTAFVWVCTILAAITFMPGLYPYSEFSPFDFKLPAALTKQLDGKLNGAEILFEGEIKGPEAFDAYDGVLYTTMHGGAVSKLVGNKFVDVVKFGEKCDGFWEEEKCGRPLGLKFDKQGRLYVVDTYYGIYRVDVKTGKYEKIIDTSVPIAEKVPMTPNSIDVADNGDLYWTISSSEYKLSDGLLSILCNPSGRLIRYNAVTKQNEVLLDNLGWANGIKLSDDESFVIVAETGTSRIVKYHLKGPQAGNSEVFIEGLPGIPDNIHTDGQGNFFVSLISTADAEHPQLFQSLAPHFNLRKMVVRTITLLQKPFKLFEQFYPNYYSKRIAHWLGHFESMSGTFTTSSVLRIDSTGKILDYLADTDGKIYGISSAFAFDDYLYLGSPFNNYLARVPLDQALPHLKKVFKSEPVVIEQKPTPVQVPTTTERPPPKTTTPAPTPPPPVVTTTPPPVQEPKIIVQPVEVPVVPMPVEVPVVPKPLEVPVVQKPVEVPVVPKPVEVPVIPKPVELPAVPIQVEVPQVPRPVEAPAVQKPVEVPAIPKPVEVPIVPQPQQVPAVPKPVEKPVVVQRVEQPQLVPQAEKRILRDEM